MPLWQDLDIFSHCFCLKKFWGQRFRCLSHRLSFQGQVGGKKQIPMSWLLSSQMFTQKSSCKGTKCVSHPAAFLEQRYTAKSEGLKHGFIPFYCSKKTIWTDSSNFPSYYLLPPPSFSDNLIICTHIDLVSYWWWHSENCIFLSDNSGFISIASP